MNSSRIRSAVIRSRSAAIAVIAATHVRVHGEAQLGGEPGRPQHPQWVVAERLLRACPGYGSPWPARSSSPPYGSVNRWSGRLTAIALIVKSRRCRSSSEAGAVRHHRVAADPVVRLGAERGDLQPQAVAAAAPIVPNSRPVSQIASAQPLTIAQRLRPGARRCRSRGRRRAGRAARPAPNRRPGAARGRRGEPAAQLVGDRGDPQQFGDGVALRGGEFAAVGGVRSGGFGHGIASLSGRGVDPIRRARVTGGGLTMVCARAGRCPARRTPGRLEMSGGLYRSAQRRARRRCRRAVPATARPSSPPSR